MGHQATPHGSLCLPCGFYQSVSHTEGIALLFELEWVPKAPHPPTPLPSHPLTPIDSIRDITGTEKTIQKTNSIQVACRHSYEMIPT